MDISVVFGLSVSLKVVHGAGKRKVMSSVHREHML